MTAAVSNLDRVRIIANRMSAGRKFELDEMIGDGCIGLAKASAAYDPTRAKFSTFSDFLIRGAIIDGIRARSPYCHQYYSKHRQEFPYLVARTKAILLHEAQPVAERDFEQYSAYRQKETAERVRTAVWTLPRRQRLVILLHYFEAKSLEDISKILGVVPSRISQIHTEALRRLRRILSLAEAA